MRWTPNRLKRNDILLLGLVCAHAEEKINWKKSILLEVLTRILANSFNLTELIALFSHHNYVNMNKVLYVFQSNWIIKMNTQGLFFPL